MSLGLALASRSVIVGSWLAAVGVPMLGVEATAEFGIPLSRLVVVDVQGGPAVWAERVAAAADGFDVVLTCPPAGAERVVRKVRTRLQARGVVMIVVGSVTPGVSCDLEFTTTSVTWGGLGQGFGHLTTRRATVRAGGRRMPRPVELDLWLPGPDGRITPVESCAKSVSRQANCDQLSTGVRAESKGAERPIRSDPEHNSQLLSRAG